MLVEPLVFLWSLVTGRQKLLLENLKLKQDLELAADEREQWKESCKNYSYQLDRVYAVLDQEFDIVPYNYDTKKYDEPYEMVRRIRKVK